MAFSFDNAFGIHAVALPLRAQRMQIIASNLANADTPNYKARDVDFRDMLQDERSGSSLKTYRTNDRHLGMSATVSNDDLKYRVPLQPSEDGNTVDAQFEQTSFADNAVRYQATLMFLTGKIRGLSEAITGGMR
ncbi:MAG: flagellar basal body rod protein FlgB [Gammaproteobacteria bacterium]|nr:flagellar basal body rod protein FlgB [Gammaproteobacteria bacterium]NND59477.1 flagellar basal body rod protein FlgB [Gammaproteobacteria bacterium]